MDFEILSSFEEKGIGASTYIFVDDVTILHGGIIIRFISMSLKQIVYSWIFLALYRHRKNAPKKRSTFSFPTGRRTDTEKNLIFCSNVDCTNFILERFTTEKLKFILFRVWKFGILEWMIAILIRAHVLRAETYVVTMTPRPTLTSVSSLPIPMDAVSFPIMWFHHFL